MNFSDSERIAAFLEEKELKPAEKIEQADLVIFNTCGVRQTAEDRVYGQVHNLRKEESRIMNHESSNKKKLIITGCLAHRKDVQIKLKDKVDVFLTIDDFFKNCNIKNYPEYSGFKIPAQKDNSRFENKYLCIKPRYHSKKNALVPIMTGCNNFCSYCVVPYARGREWSRPPEDVFKEVENLAKSGCKEITLLGQNVNSYKCKVKSRLPVTIAIWAGKSKVKITNKNLKLIRNSKFEIRNFYLTFPILLDNLAKKYPKISWRFLSSHPKDFSDELIKVIAENKNISQEIHLPIQSGSNKILKKMNRPYTQKKYLNLMAKIKKQIPNAKFSTDAIVGFPGETKKDFQETAKVFRKIKFFEAYINKYSPRPETAAFKLGNPVLWKEKKRRENVLRKLIKK